MGCTRCASGRCARPHAWRWRKRVTDLSTGDVFERIRIRRVIFCDGKTVSLMPWELWRGYFTVPSMVETAVHIFRDGLRAAYDWCWEAGRDGSPVSPRTLRRWRSVIRERLIGSAVSWLGPHLGLSWSTAKPEAAELQALLDGLSAQALLAFRARFGRACLDRARSEKRNSARAGFSAPRIAGRGGESPPHDPPRPLRPRGAWRTGQSRRSPPGDSKGGPDP